MGKRQVIRLRSHLVKQGQNVSARKGAAVMPPPCFYCPPGAAPDLGADNAALQASDSLSLLSCMHWRLSGPVLPEQNFCTSSRQAAIRPPPAGACAKATPIEPANSNVA